MRNAPSSSTRCVRGCGRSMCHWPRVCAGWLPSSRTRSDSSRASSISWVISTAAVLWVAISCSSSCCMSARVTSSSAPNGSSSNSTSGWRARQRASAVRWAMPPDNCAGYWPRAWARPTAAIAWSMRARRSAAASFGWRAKSRPKATFFSRLNQGNRLGSWKATARRGCGPCSGWPCRVTLPPRGCCRPASTRSRLDLPTPLGPRMVTTSPGASCRSNCASTACQPPSRG
ncbi:hypothetical protein D3C81_779080 [compost metagenome]